MPRPKIEWSDKEYQMIEYMTTIHCTQQEIAGVMGIDEDTLNRLIKEKYDCSFSEFYKKNSDAGKMSLRRAQFKAAEKGNSSLLIWLGKQWLGQRDVQDINLSQDIDDTVKEMNEYFDNKK